MDSDPLQTPNPPETTRWDWPGARWWRCDFHLHTPASPDFDEGPGITAERWVASVVEAGLEAVAVTDHNTGGWIDKVRRAAARLEGGPVIFPGVELTVEPRVHLLFLFDPQHDASSVAALLGQCGITGRQMGQPGACARCSVVEALNWGAQHGALCIAAHADDAKGVLRQVDPGQALMRIVTHEHLAAAEVRDLDAPSLAYLDNSKDGYRRALGPLPLVAFSDGHGVADIGQRCTWFKMTRPSLEGLRLALQDGAVELSDHRPQQVAGDKAGLATPNTHGELAIESLRVTRTGTSANRRRWRCSSTPGSTRSSAVGAAASRRWWSFCGWSWGGAGSCPWPCAMTSTSAVARRPPDTNGACSATRPCCRCVTARTAAGFR